MTGIAFVIGMFIGVVMGVVAGYIDGSRNGRNVPLKGTTTVEYNGTGIIELAIGLLTEEERQKLTNEGYTPNGKTTGEQPYEVWMRQLT